MVASLAYPSPVVGHVEHQVNRDQLHQFEEAVMRTVVGEEVHGGRRDQYPCDRCQRNEICTVEFSCRYRFVFIDDGLVHFKPGIRKALAYQPELLTVAKMDDGSNPVNEGGFGPTGPIQELNTSCLLN